MSAPVITAPARRQASTGHWAFGAIAFVGLAFVITLIAFQIASPTPAQQAVDRSHYGAGYPLHGGLAGPSQVGEDD